jgi:hypothetical protein
MSQGKYNPGTSINHIISIGDKTISLRAQDFDTDVDLDKLLSVDYNNIIGDIITFPVIFNRIANLRADLIEAVSSEKLNLKILEAKLAEKYRRKGVAAGTTRVTAGQIENQVLLDEEFIAASRALITVEKNSNVVDALYWAAKSKDGKLDGFLMKMKPDEFIDEILEESINNVVVRVRRGPIHH